MLTRAYIAYLGYREEPVGESSGRGYDKRRVSQLSRVRGPVFPPMTFQRKR